MVRRLILLALGAVLIVLLTGTVAVAAHSPQDIYNDFAKNGQLSKQYTDAELQAYRNNATLDQYTDPSVKRRLDSLVDTLLTPESTRGTFPFTGFQMVIAGIVAVALVGGGLALRRISRAERS